MDDRDRDRRFWETLDESYGIEPTERRFAERLLARMVWLSRMPLLFGCGLVLENLDLLPIGGFRPFEYLCWFLVGVNAGALLVAWLTAVVVYCLDREGFWNLFIRTTPGLFVRSESSRAGFVSARLLGFIGWFVVVQAAVLVGKPVLAAALAVTFLFSVVTSRVEATLVRRKLADLDL